MIAQKLILSYGTKVTMQFVQIAVSIVVARVAGPTVLGTVAFGLAFVSIFSFIADLGTGSAHIKLVSEGKDLGKCIATFSVIKIVLAGVFFLVVVAVFLIQKYVFNLGFESAAHQYVIFIMLLTIVIRQLLGIVTITFSARTEQAKRDIPDVIRTFLWQLFRIIVVVLGFGAIALASVNLVSTILVIPMLILLFKGYPFAHFDKDLVKQYIKISVPFMVMSMTTTVAFYLDRVVLQYYTNSAQVGFYTAGYKIGGLIFMVATSVGLLFFPLFSKAASNGDFFFIRNLIEKFERFSFLFIMPFVIFLSIYSDVIIKVLLGNQYLSSIPVMAIVNLAMFFAVLNVPYGNVVTGMGYFKLAALVHLANLFFFILLVFVLMNPRMFDFGATGVALALLGSNIFIGCLYRFFAKQKCSVLHLSKNAKFIVFGVVNFVIFHFVYSHLSDLYSGKFKIAFVLVYFCLTYAMYLLLGWIEKKDVSNLKMLVNFNRMSQYIKEEMRGK